MLNGARCCLPTPIGGSAVRIACLCISPSLPATVALRQRHDLRGHPALIVDHAPGTSRIVDASPAAAGVVAGMTLAAALARCPDAIVLEADAPACRHLFQQVCRAPQGAGTPGTAHGGAAAGGARAGRGGAVDAITPNRRRALWEAEGAIPPARGGQRALAVATEVPTLADWSASEKMVGEYRALGLYPRGHLMAFVRPTLPPDVRPAAAVAEAADGTVLRVTRTAGQASRDVPIDERRPDQPLIAVIELLLNLQCVAIENSEPRWGGA